MKSMKKLLALTLVLVLISALSVTAFAATITIQTPTSEIAPTEDSIYTVYKVFDATVNPTDTSKVSYKLCSGDTLSADMIAAGFEVDAAGNVAFLGGTIATDGSADDTIIKAIAGYVTDDDIVDTVTIAAGNASGASKNLDPGYYYVTTSTGSAVMIKTNNAADTVEIKDKNIISDVDKVAGTQYNAAAKAAIAAVGTSQPFTAKITKRHGATNMVFEDTMTNMTFNNDVVITVSAGTAPTAAQAVVAATTNGFTVTFDNDYIAKLADDTDIILNYSATITSDALSTDPATNTASLTTGNGNRYTDEPVKVYNAKFTVTKQDNDKKPLAGAGFVLKNADGKYYSLVASSGTAPASIDWVDDVANATEYTSDDTGAVTAFTGLGAGTYTLIENTVPDGYNKAADSTFTIKDNDYTAANLEQTATVTNESGAELPSTGGIGTTLFYVIGSILFLGAAVVLVSKRRVRE